MVMPVRVGSREKELGFALAPLLALWAVAWAAGRPARPRAQGSAGDELYFGLPLQKITEADWKDRVTSTAPLPGRDDPLPMEYAIRPLNGGPALRYPEENEKLFVTLSLKPRVLYFPRLLTDDECDLLVAIATKQLFKSKVANRQQTAANRNKLSSARTSKGSWIDLPQSGPLGIIRERLTHIVSSQWHENLQVLKYDVGQHYDAHTDYFDPSLYGDQYSNRALTFFLYLNTVPAGGETTFPRAGGLRMPVDMHSGACSSGLRVRPTKGAAVLFYNMRPDFSLDQYALHGGCDVAEGEKWAAPLWFRVAIPKGGGLLK
ncbi:putative prolyl 4-hydroxylase 9 [Diplonema papillatum]|nr:putative prolyl 4-hydroxylase 9 [Diplonema papillatum]|eukprot:gene10645-16382_t